MASSDKPKVVDRDVKKKDHKDEKKGGFIGVLLGFIEKEANLVFDVLVENPTIIPIPLIDINYLIESGGRKLVSGLIPDAGTIHAHGKETIKIPVNLIYDDIKSTIMIRPGSIIPYRIKVDFIVDIPIFGRLTLPLEKTGEIPIPHKPDIDLEKINLKRFSFEETVAVLHLKLENTNDFDLGLNGLDCEVWLSDESIGGAEIAKSTKVDKKGIGYIDIPITFRPKDFGSAIWDIIRSKSIHYAIKGHINVDTPFGAMKLPIGKEGGTTRIKKNKDDDDDDDDDDEVP
ncbi:hypothetical protein GH714_020586 [Hevea brasiliensis]|uniref:Water stress and hypersensitive response domain-containing protein n=1 Tax=Hevea brasiliensis TaxID=3981 RepID=A0A6A6LB32_HEVBR|nr:hypothetical protein GH714_020586 [Hevea brasiliensis]